MNYDTTLGGRNLHIYVTRTAAIAYGALTRTQFETARRSLTERLLHAKPDPRAGPGWYMIDAGIAGEITAFAQQEGQLLVIPKIKQVADRE